MISYQTYKLLHFLGIFLLLVSLGGVSLHAANAGTKASNVVRGLVAAMHGLGAFLTLLGGFGLLARIGFQHGGGFPGWLWTKLVVWAVLGVIIILPYRRPAFARPILVVLPLLALLAAGMAIHKPF